MKPMRGSTRSKTARNVQLFNLTVGIDMQQGICQLTLIVSNASEILCFLLEVVRTVERSLRQTTYRDP
jgi:hypothetical protein